MQGRRADKIGSPVGCVRTWGGDEATLGLDNSATDHVGARRRAKGLERFVELSSMSELPCERYLLSRWMGSLFSRSQRVLHEGILVERERRRSKSDEDGVDDHGKCE